MDGLNSKFNNESPRAKARGFSNEILERPLFIRTLKGADFWPRKYKAFSLLELLLSIALLSTGIVAILQALAFSAKVTATSCDIISAAFLSEDRIQEIEFKEKQGPITEEVLRGQNGKFEWESRISPEPDLNLYRLEFDIGWQGHGRREGFTLYTYLRK